MTQSSTNLPLSGQIAVITGAGRGIGQAVAIKLSQLGAHTVLCGRSRPALEQTAAAIDTQDRTSRDSASGTPRTSVIECDVTDLHSVEALARLVDRTFHRIDILVNNAGISQLSFTATEDLPIEEWDKILAVNLRGTFLCCKHVGKQMIASGGGSIVNISSTAGITGVVRAPAYCASKAGTILLTKSLALEWARYHIRVNAIAPHYLETELTKGLRASEKVYDGLARQIPLRRFAKPEEIVGTVLLLSSPASSYITGSVNVVDGGYLAQ